MSIFLNQLDKVLYLAYWKDDGKELNVSIDNVLLPNSVIELPKSMNNNYILLEEGFKYVAGFKVSSSFVDDRFTVFGDVWSIVKE